MNGKFFISDGIIFCLSYHITIGWNFPIHFHIFDLKQQQLHRPIEQRMFIFLRQLFFFLFTSGIFIKHCVLVSVWVPMAAKGIAYADC